MWSDRRLLVSLLGSVIIALSAGSVYVFSSYAPQVQNRLHLSSLQLNLLAIASNMGLYISGPIWGRIVDRNGPYTALWFGAACTLVGYGAFSYAYTKGWDDIPVALLSLFMFFSGVGNQAALCGSINVQAKSWGGNHRGTAMAIVLSAFALSAFMYSTVSRVFFDNNVGGYLLSLAIGSSASFVIGSLMIKVIPPDVSELEARWSHVPDGEQPEPARPRLARSSSELSGEAYAWSQQHAGYAADPDSEDPFDEPTAHHNEVSGTALLKNTDFLLLFSLLGLISGAGLVLINNVGVITHALWDYNHRKNAGRTAGILLKKSAEQLQHVQAAQVSLISLANAFSRINTGFLSDLIATMSHDPTRRSVLLLVVTLVAVLSQLLSAWPGVIVNVDRLLYVSIATGLMYGMLFGLCPVLVFEWFGEGSFSQNWGWMSWGPVITGNAYNLWFGYVYDSHVKPTSHSHTCHLGSECYRSVFYVTTVGCFIAFVISVVLVMRRANGAYERVQRLVNGIFQGVSGGRLVLH